MKLRATLDRVFDFILDFLAFLAGILVVFLMLSVVLEVVLRYFFGSPTSWVVEIAGYILLFVPFMVGAWVLKRESHVRMDLLLNRLSPRTRALLNAITATIGVIVCLILTIFGIKTALYFRGYQTPTILMLPKSLIISIIFVGCFLLFIQFIRRAHGHWLEWKTPDQEEGPEDASDGVMR
jgi:TRAP-type C4-dicarboxylate transport system permease small subunit